jgi:N-acetylglucosaminyl-diphospho-decaprenol L-rhamnosyltransferase
MKVSGIFVVTGAGEAEMLRESLLPLHAQVDELVVVANGRGSRPASLPPDVLVVENEQPLGFSANVNKGIAATSGEYVVISNPDAIPEPGSIAALAEFADSHPRCGVAGPKMLNPDGTLQASRRSFPTIGGTIVRRTPLRSLFPPLRWQKHHYLLDAPTDEPLQVDTMLGAFLLMRRTMLEQIGGWDAGYKLYVEDIDLSYRAMKAGWERWWVPAAVVRHEYQAVIDKHFFTRRNLWHAHAMLRFLRKHPERLFALR